MVEDGGRALADIALGSIASIELQRLHPSRLRARQPGRSAGQTALDPQPNPAPDRARDFRSPRTANPDFDTPIDAAAVFVVVTGHWRKLAIAFGCDANTVERAGIRLNCLGDQGRACL